MHLLGNVQSTKERVTIASHPAMANGSSGASWSVGDTVERELDEDVWIQAVVEASFARPPGSRGGSPCWSFTVVYSDGSREEGVSGEDLRDPPNPLLRTPPQSPPQLSSEDHTKIKSIGDDSDKQSALAFEAREARGHAFSHPTRSEQQQQKQEAQHAAVEGLQAAFVERIAEEGQSDAVDVLARSRSVLAGGSALCARVDHAMGAMARDAIGATAAVEADWQRYRARHDLLPDALSEFGRSFTAETWEAFSAAQGSVMAGLMQGVTLPAPQLGISPNNSRQLLSRALQHEKGRRQQQWCEQWRTKRGQRLRCADRGVPESFCACGCSDSQLGCMIWEDTSSLAGGGLHSIRCERDGTATIPVAALGDGSGSATVSQPAGRESNIDWCTVVRAVCEGRQPQWASHLEEFVRGLHCCCFDFISRQQLYCRLPVLLFGSDVGRTSIDTPVQQTNGSDGQVVQPGDPRLGLIGQRAVRVKERNFAPEAENAAALTEAEASASAASSVIPSGSVLLHYAGTLHTETEFNDRYDFQQQ